MTRLPRFLAAAAVTFLAAAGPLAGRAGSAVPADVAVISSAGLSAVVEVFSRVPADSDGGLLFSRSVINADKAVAVAAGFTAGDLAETFFESSSPDYENRSLVTAQHPPSGTVPAEAAAEGGQRSPEGAPVDGRGYQITARATEAPAALAEATGAAIAHEAFTVGSGASSSVSELRGDGSLVTRVEASAEDVVIGGVLTIAQAVSVAETVVPAAGDPFSTLAVTVAGAEAGGVAVEITPDGITAAGSPPAGADGVAALNGALASLAAQGIRVAAVPAQREMGATSATAAGSALVVRYSFAQQIGGDEEIALAAVRSASVLERRAPAEPLPDLGLPPLPASEPVRAAEPVPGPATPGGAPATERPPVNASPPSDASRPSPAPSPPRASASPLRVPAGAPASVASPFPDPPPAPGPAPDPAATASPDPVVAAPDFGVSAAPVDLMAAELSSGYGILVLCALAGVVLLVVRMKSRIA